MPLTLTFVSALVMDLFTITKRIPDRGETLMASHMEEHPGGKGCNAGIAAYRYSRAKPDGPNATTKAAASPDDEINVRVVGAIGDDSYGQFCLAPLKASNIDVSGIRVRERQHTGISTVIVESDYNENRILQTSGANASLRPDDFDTIESICGDMIPDLLTTQIELPRDTVEHILKFAANEKIPTLLNPSPAQVVLEEVLAQVTHLVVNETEAALLSGMDLKELKSYDDWDRVTEEFLSTGVENVVLTLGAQGAYYANNLGHKGHVLAEKIENVKDPTGAGYVSFNKRSSSTWGFASTNGRVPRSTSTKMCGSDTFVGVYAVEYVKQKRIGKWNIKHAVECACKAAACTIQKIGCQSAIPWGDEVGHIQHTLPLDVPPTEDEESLTLNDQVGGGAVESFEYDPN